MNSRELRRLHAGAGVLLALSLTASAQQGSPVITVEGQSFDTWQEYTSSHLFELLDKRCGGPKVVPLRPEAPSDCGASTTSILPQYDPTSLIEIPVVVHVIAHTNGSGQISDAMIESQIDVLNEDFRAIAGTNGGNGTDGMIRFYLAQVDPAGNPTTGITRTVNDTWFNDSGNYWTPLHWDTTEYLNIYTNSASGNLGYVPTLPQGGIVGTEADRVVVLWSSFGRNSPIGPPYDKGRTTTHEVGHYLGLYHTFQGGCAAVSNCYGNGDRLCDTAAEAVPTFGCPGSKSSCGTPDPVDNYMDYSDDLCMERFTPEQVNRMRCTIENWRPDLPEVPCPAASVASRNGGTNLDVFTSSAPVLGEDWVATVDGTGTGYTTGLLLLFGAPASTSLGNGSLLLVDLASPQFLNVSAPGPVAVWSTPLPNSTALCGFPAYAQGALLGGLPGYVLTNSQDLILGR